MSSLTSKLLINISLFVLIQFWFCHGFDCGSAFQQTVRMFMGNNCQPEPLISRSAMHNSKLADFVYRIQAIEFEIKDTKDTDRSASYHDLHLEFDNDCLLRTKHYDKRDYFNFHIVNFPFICSNITAATEYGVYITRLVRYF